MHPLWCFFGNVPDALVVGPVAVTEQRKKAAACEQAVCRRTAGLHYKNNLENGQPIFRICLIFVQSELDAPPPSPPPPSRTTATETAATTTTTTFFCCRACV